MTKLKKYFLAVFGALFAVMPAWADPITMLDGFQVSSGKVGIRSDKNEMRSSGGTGIATIKYVDSTNNNRTYTVPDSGADANYVMTEGSQTINGAKTFSTSPVLPSGSVKRKFFTLKASPGGGVACSNATVYFEMQPLTRAGTVKAISWVTHVDPVSGTNTVKLLKNGASGTTLLSTASVSLNGSTADTIQSGTLTGTTANLNCAAGDNLYFEYSAGTQGAAAKDVTCVVEYEPTDY